MVFADIFCSECRPPYFYPQQSLMTVAISVFVLYSMYHITMYTLRRSIVITETGIKAFLFRLCFQSTKTGIA